MGIVHDFEKHKYGINSDRKQIGKGLRQNPSCCGVPQAQLGDGIFDVVKGAVDLAVQNKDLIKSVAQSAGSVAGAAGKISEAVKAAKRFNDLKELQPRTTPKSEARRPLPPNVKQAIQDISRNKAGDGFEKF